MRASKRWQDVCVYVFECVCVWFCLCFALILGFEGYAKSVGGVVKGGHLS